MWRVTGDKDALNAQERSLFFGPVRALMNRQPGKDLLMAWVRRDAAVIAEESSDFALPTICPASPSEIATSRGND